MAYIDQHTSATSQDFVRRLAIAITKQSIIVTVELSAVLNHANRVALAKQVANDPMAMAAKMAFVVCADPVTAAAITDTTMDALVGAVWDTVAGVAAS